MSSLMLVPTNGTGGWSINRNTHGKTQKALKAALGLGRGKARREMSAHRRALPGTDASQQASLKQCARRLATSNPKNDSERELKELATRWLANKRG